MLLAALVTGVSWSGAGAVIASEAHASTCARSSDGRITVLVVIDTGSGPVAVRCVSVPRNASGADALFAAVGADPRTGVRTGAGVDGKGEGFVCGVLGVPSVGCVEDATDPSWSYWHASPGGTWTYSTVGVGSYRIGERHGAADGCTIEGWRFGVVDPADPSSSRPSVSPGGLGCSAAPSSAPASGPTSGPTTGADRPAPVAPGPAVGAAAPAAGSPSTTGPPPATVAGAAAVGSEVAGSAGVPPTTAAAPGDPPAPEPPVPSDGVSGELAAATAPDGAAGPGPGALVAAALVVGLGAVAVVRLRGRRSTSS
jgi:hypothetical protein